MSVAIPFPPSIAKALPTHLDLPDTDGLPVPTHAEPTQTRLLTESIRPVLNRIHPDGMYIIGQDNGIYYRITDPPLKGCKSPDWYYIPGVNPTPTDYPYRRSHVLWQEKVKPVVLIEYVSDDSGNEWDRTPEQGKFWVYENVFEAQYYAIHTHATGALEIYHRVRGKLERMRPNKAGHYPISTFGVELGTRRQRLDGFDLEWLRWYDSAGNLLPSDEERATQERLKKEEAEQRAEDAEEEIRRLADKLREHGINPEKL